MIHFGADNALPSPLTPLLETELAKALRGNCRHYGILCQNHVVDVVTTTEPVVQEASVGIGRCDEWGSRSSWN